MVRAALMSNTDPNALGADAGRNMDDAIYFVATASPRAEAEAILRAKVQAQQAGLVTTATAEPAERIKPSTEAEDSTEASTEADESTEASSEAEESSDEASGEGGEFECAMEGMLVDWEESRSEEWGVDEDGDAAMGES